MFHGPLFEHPVIESDLVIMPNLVEFALLHLLLVPHGHLDTGEEHQLAHIQILVQILLVN